MARQTGQNTQSQGLIAHDVAGARYEEKSAALIHPFAWESGPVGVTDTVEALKRYRDYRAPASVQVWEQHTPWPDPQSGLDPAIAAFSNWANDAFVVVGTHGRGDRRYFHLMTGVVIGRKRRGAEDPEGLTCGDFYALPAASQQGFSCGMAAAQGRFVQVDPDQPGDFIDDSPYSALFVLSVDIRWLRAHHSDLRAHPTLISLMSCGSITESYDDARLSDFFDRTHSALYGWDGTVYLPQISSHLDVLTEHMITNGLNSYEAWGLMTEEQYTSAKNPISPTSAKLWHLGTAPKGVHVREAITVLDPQTGEEVRNGARLPIRPDDQGRPRVMDILVRIDGVLEEDLDEQRPNLEYIYAWSHTREQDWAVWVEELDGPGGRTRAKVSPQDTPTVLGALGATKIGDHSWTIPLRLTFERDLTDDDPLHLRAYARLPYHPGDTTTHTFDLGATDPPCLSWTFRAHGQTWEGDAVAFDGGAFGVASWTLGHRRMRTSSITGGLTLWDQRDPQDIQGTIGMGNGQGVTYQCVTDQESGQAAPPCSITSRRSNGRIVYEADGQMLWLDLSGTPPVEQTVPFSLEVTTYPDAEQLPETCQSATL